MENIDRIAQQMNETLQETINRLTYERDFFEKKAKDNEKKYNDLLFKYHDEVRKNSSKV
jgi:hypothetical protein